MKEKVKRLEYSLLGIGIFLGLILLVLLFIKGGLWLNAILYPYLVPIFQITFTVCILILLPIAIFKKTRQFSSIAFFIASYVFGIITWIWSFLLAYVSWGFIGLLIGLLIGGVGVIPIAMLATIFNGKWAALGQLVLLIVFTFGFRFLAIYFAEKADDNC